MPSIDRSILFRLILYPLILLTLTLGAGEVILKYLNPPMRTQMVSLDPAIAAREEIALDEEEGVLLWRSMTGRDNLDCGADDASALHVLVLGDSIAYGSGVAHKDTFAFMLEEQLSTNSQKVCVHNLAVPGTGFIQQSLLALEGMERHSPDLIVWTLWSSTIKAYSIFGNMGHDLSRFDTDEEGVPETVVPGPLNRLLFRFSAFYRYAVITLKKERDMAVAWKEFARDEFGPRLDRVQKLKPAMPMLFVNSTPLDTPFATQAYRRKEGHDRWGQYNRPYLHAELKERNIALLQLDEALGDAPVTEVRVDKCCHFNARGMELIADILRPRVASLLNLAEQP